MESETNCINDHNTPPPPTPFPSISLKLERLDDEYFIDFSSSISYLQDFQNLDQIPFTVSSFNSDMAIQGNDIDPFGQSYSCTDFGLYEFKPYEENGEAMQDFQGGGGGGFVNFPDRKDSLMEIEMALKYHDSMPLSFVIPDESSCVTADNPGFKEDGSKRSKNCSDGSESVTTKSGWGWKKKSKSYKGQWTNEEDRVLIHLVEKYGVRKWSNIAQMLKGRIGKQCRERWHNHLRPDIKKDVWTEDEDRILIEVHAQVGNKWAEIAKSLPGRTENSIKNHWNATKRRQFSRRKCRTKWPRPSSLLQNYIKSLHFDKENSGRTKNTQPPTTTDSAILHNTSTNAPQNPEVEFSSDDHTVPEYEFDELPAEFTFDDDHLFKGSNLDSFMDDFPFGPPPEINNEPWFEVELPFDMPPLM